MKQFLGILLAFTVFLPLFAHADTVLRIGEDVSVSAQQVVEGDYYVSVGPFGDTTMSGEVHGDMYAFGGSVTVNGAIGSDLAVLGGTSQLHATVTDDVRIISGEATVGDHIGGDLFVIAGKLTVLSTATIEGDVIFFGGDAEINGTVNGSVLGTSERLRLNAAVAGDVDVKTMSLTLGENASVAGDVTHASPQSLVRAQNASVEGEIIHHAYAKKPTGANKVRDALVPLFVSLFAALTIFLLFKKELQLLVQEVHLHPLKNTLTGISVMVLVPIVSVLLIVTILGMLVGIVGLSAFVLVSTLGYAISGAVCGAFIVRLFTRKLGVSLLSILFGTFTLHAALFIPVVGSLLFLAILVLSIGGVSQFFYKRLS